MFVQKKLLYCTILLGYNDVTVITNLLCCSREFVIAKFDSILNFRIQTYHIRFFSPYVIIRRFDQILTWASSSALPRKCFQSHLQFSSTGFPCYIPGVAKVRPFKDFLRPLCQIFDEQLSFFVTKSTLNWHLSCHTERKPKIQYLNEFLHFLLPSFIEIWPVSKKPGHPCYIR